MVGPAKDAVISLAGVTFRYEGAGRAALEDVSLEVFRGDFLGIIGPNGGGKTTLLKLVLGLLEPEVGVVRVFGEAAVKGRARIGYVPQHATIDAAAPASVLDLVLMGRLAVSRWGMWFGRGDRERAMGCLEMVGCADLAGRAYQSLSGGQKQRVLIARALVADAEVLLLDEPTTGVDPRAQRGLTELLHRLHERMPIVMVSHDISFVTSQLNRVACLNGRLSVHAIDELSHDQIERTYAGPVTVLHHHEEDCPIHPQGHEAGGDSLGEGEAKI
ncbi:metal ABC transporter ATP-binding protein [Mucisphaera sp.]|uniref:metal ABC transporter ATP-binding protein n=1 Tax=Mucisphaera sp. TaxID=2913024 RepID=UPI003D127AC0